MRRRIERLKIQMGGRGPPVMSDSLETTSLSELRTYTCELDTG
jgi:hypothetical protein